MTLTGQQHHFLFWIRRRRSILQGPDHSWANYNDYDRCSRLLVFTVLFYCWLVLIVCCCWTTAGPTTSTWTMITTADPGFLYRCVVVIVVVIYVVVGVGGGCCCWAQPGQPTPHPPWLRPLLQVVIFDVVVVVCCFSSESANFLLSQWQEQTTKRTTNKAHNLVHCRHNYCWYNCWRDNFSGVRFHALCALSFLCLCVFLACTSHRELLSDPKEEYLEIS